MTRNGRAVQMENDNNLETEELEMYYCSCGSTNDKNLETAELEIY